VCALALFASACASSSQPAQPARQAESPKVLVYSGATVEAEVARAIAPPPPLEPDGRKQMLVRELGAEVMPCDLLVESIPSGVAITFFTRNGSNMHKAQIREQVELLAHVHNTFFDVPEASPGVIDEPLSLHFDPSRTDHAPLRALMAIPSRAEVEDAPRGARLLLTTPDAKDLADLRAHVLWHAQELLPEIMLGRTRCPHVPAELRATR
jgi:hypothetical protein